MPSKLTGQLQWVCEFCFKISKRNRLPAKWDFILQSAVCPQCQRRVQSDGGYGVVKGGAYANGKRDPRALNKKAKAPHGA